MQELDKIGFQLMISHKDNLYIEVKYFNDNEHHRIKGYIDSINYEDKYIDIVDKLGYNEFTTVKFDEVVKVLIL
ncbi:YolD-like family protein [Oceanobacillus sojae]|uniref:YolD-like family protein n=1 Tax=Oceanobacillus sojae TaxID=582851 RepID=UPI0021A62D0B|nr:YolD-like family protein [Oceanobacillus sojae]MCT1904137.1 YolD-like family protein [Oceanobacillus sojae]